MIVDFIHLQSKPIEVSFIDVDCDAAAERLMVFSRKSAEVLSHKRIVEGRFTAVLKKEHALSSDLMCVMLDDDAEFNAAIADNVQPMLINLVTFDPSNPQPYEPPIA